MLRLHINIQDSWVTSVCEMHSPHLSPWTLTHFPGGRLMFDSFSALQSLCVQSIRDDR